MRRKVTNCFEEVRQALEKKKATNEKDVDTPGAAEDQHLAGPHL